MPEKYVLAIKLSGIFFVSPKLWLSPCNSVNENVRRMPKGEGDGTSILVALISVLVVPRLTVSEEECFSVATHGDVLATQAPCSGASGIGDGETVREPVLDVGAPGESAVDGNINVL